MTTTRANPGAGTAWLSWLRVFAILGVVTIHSVGATAAGPDARETLRGQLAIVLDIGAIFAVPVFVMLSGAMMLDPARFTTPGDFLRRRAARLVPAVIFWHAWYVGIRLFVLDEKLTADEITARILNGQLYTALFFFWIVLGLSVVAPVLVPFVRDHGRRATLVAGVVAALVPAVTVATTGLRDTSSSFVTNAWTWWVPYLGVFLLGYGLRGVVLRGWLLAVAAAATVGLGVLLSWQWRNESAPELLQTVSPVSYYGGGVIVYACLVFLVFQGLFQPDGPLRFATRPTAVRLGRLLGDATLGVFALHLTVLLAVQRWHWFSDERAVATTHDLLLQVAVVAVATYAIVLLLRRIPFVRGVL